MAWYKNTCTIEFKYKYFKLFILILTLLSSLKGWSGSNNCGHQVNINPKLQNANLKMMNQLIQELNKNDFKIAIIARAGADISQWEGLENHFYTHAAFLIRGKKKKGPKTDYEYFTYGLLNECDTDYSGIYRQGLYYFFIDNPIEYKSNIIFLNAKIEEKLVRVLTKKNMIKYHNKKYNILSNPFTNEFQNCNQWIMELIALAQIEGTPNLSHNDLINFYKHDGYQPSHVHLSMHHSLYATFTDNITLTEKTINNEVSGKHPLATYKSVYNYLKLKDFVRLDKTILLTSDDI